MAEEFKFLHASDFHLDQPLEGLAEIPSHLKSAMIEAPYAAAKRVFDIAISEKVDFLLLSGDLFDADYGGCRAAAFLLAQFERLAEKNISVYWCSGAVDHPDRWPAAVNLPANVRTFSSNLVEEIFHTRRERTLATIVASGHDSRRRPSSDFLVDSAAPFPIVLTHGDLDLNAVGTKHIRYWAVGGAHRQQILEKTAGLWVSAGTPQSRRASETGAHGCVLVRVDGLGQMRTQFVETDHFRWLPQQIEVAENVDLEELKNVMGERALRLVSDYPERLLLVDWLITTTGSFNPQLRHAPQVERLLDWLRREFGAGTVGLWSTEITIAAPPQLPAGWLEEDTILGDFLRAMRRYQGDESISLALHEYLPKHWDSQETGTWVRLTAAERAEVLAAAELLGVEYLAAQRDWEDAAASSEA